MKQTRGIARAAGLITTMAVATLAPATLAAQHADPRGAIFLTQGCTQCHSVWALGLKAKSDVGPDLTFAYVDVVNRYGVDLQSFLYNPEGVMRLMLASHLNLSAASRDSIAHVLEGIYKQHRADARHEIPSIVADTPTRN
ncbi:MAG TPA: hypothetical protein VLV16_00905 [Gemmatimonadales bacterium]|nr:hypothetical protein [Gemmatimonadales bacterium]